MTLSALQQEKHRHLDVSQVRKSGRAVQNVITAVSHFTNPWRTPNKEKIFSLASEAPVPADVEVDAPRADAVGKTLKEDFIHNRLGYAITKCFFNMLKRQKLRSMEDNNKFILHIPGEVNSVSGAKQLSHQTTGEIRNTRHHLTLILLWDIHYRRCHTALGQETSSLLRAIKSQSCIS